MVTRRNYSNDFETFWRAYPHRVGKLSAERAYVKARAKASADELLEGVARYIQYKPSYAEYCHPASWLNAGRWLDEAPARPGRRDGIQSSSTCPHDPQCETRHACIDRTIADGRKARAS